MKAKNKRRNEKLKSERKEEVVMNSEEDVR